MSSSRFGRQTTESKNIPHKRVVIHDPSQMPSYCSSTPGGTLYSTTPGGTKIVYERAFLMNLRSSPISQTPPRYDIPNYLLKGAHHNSSVGNNIPSPTKKNMSTIEDSATQFHMDI